MHGVDVLSLYWMLEECTIRTNYDRKTTAGTGRTVLCGFNQRRKDCLTQFAKRHVYIYDELQALSKRLFNEHFRNFMINKNFVSQPHFDRKNQSRSIIFSLGDYEGGELVVGDATFDTHLNPVCFDGAKTLHYNLPLKKGTKYAIVCFN